MTSILGTTSYHIMNPLSGSSISNSGAFVLTTIIEVVEFLCVKCWSWGGLISKVDKKRKNKGMWVGCQSGFLSDTLEYLFLVSEFVGSTTCVRLNDF